MLLILSSSDNNTLEITSQYKQHLRYREYIISVFWQQVYQARASPNGF